MKAKLKQLAGRPVFARPLRHATRSRHIPRAWREAVHRRVAKKIPLHGTIDIEIGGTKLVVSGDGVASYYYWLGTYEPETTEVVRRLATHASLIVDVGARDGVFAMEAAIVAPAARVLAFEPDPAANAVLRSNVAANRSVFGTRIEAVDIALSDEDGTAEFYLAGGNSSLNSTFRAGARAIEVTVRRGDGVLDQLAPDRRMDLLKVDTESTEPLVLAGFENRIARDRPAIVVEVLRGRTEDALHRFLERQSYRASWIGPDGPEAVSVIEGDPTYRYPNFLLLPSEESLVERLGGR